MKLKVMTIQQFQSHKQNCKEIPRCISCFIPILKDDKFLTLTCRHKTKLLCQFHAKYYLKHGVIIHQYPKRKTRFVGQKFQFGNGKPRINDKPDVNVSCPLENKK